MIALDASVLIALLDDRDAHHARAKGLLYQNLEHDLIIHSLTLAEVLVGAVRAQRVDDTYRELRTLGVRTSPHITGEELLLAEIRVYTGMRLADCCVLLTAQNSTAQLATFDERLATAAHSLDLVTLP